MTTIKRALLVATAMMLPAGAASALTVSYSGSFGPALTDFDDPLSTIALTGFDASLGTLTDVKLDFTVSGTASGTVTNTSATTRFFSVTELVAYSFQYPGSAFLDQLSSGQTYTLAAGATAAFGPHAISQTETFDPFDLTPYIGSSFGLTLTTLTGVTILGGGGNITTSINTLLGYDATVTYTYDEAVVPGVPEPTSWALMIGGFGLVGATMRRRAKTTTVTA